MTEPSKNLCFSEHAHHVEDFLRRGFRKDTQWIALGPSAMHRLSQKGLPYFVPEDFCSNEEVERVCVEQFDRLMQVSRKIDERLLKDDSFLRTWNIRPFLFHLWQFGQISDGVASRALHIKKILEHFHKTKVYVHVLSAQLWAGCDIGFSLEETLWGRLLALPGWNADIVCLPVTAEQRGCKREATEQSLAGLKHRFVKRLAPLVINHPFSFGSMVIQSLRHGGLSGGIKNVLHSSLLKHKSALAMLNGAYEWAEFFPKLIEQGYPIYFLHGKNLTSHRSWAGTEKSTERVERLWKDFRSIFPAMPVDVSEMIRDRLPYVVEHSPVLARNIIEKMEHFTDGKNVKGLFFSVGPDFSSYVVKQFCRIKNIPVISWQHGAEWYDKRITQRNDVLNLVSCDKMFVYGDGVKKGYESSSLSMEEGCETISVGMPSLKKLFFVFPQRKKAEEGLRILWPFGGYYGNAWYCGFSPPFNDRIYYREQVVILRFLQEFLEKYPSLRVTVKLHPSLYLRDNPPWADDIGGRDRIRLVYDKPNFAQLLPQHDIVVIDSPTTVLLQAVATKLPVFVLMSVIRWPEKACALLKRRAYCADSADGLMNKLEQYLSGERGDAHVENKDFIKHYGVHEGDGEQKAMSVLKPLLCPEQEKMGYC